MKRFAAVSVIAVALVAAAGAEVTQAPSPYRFPDGSIAPPGCPKACPSIWVPFRNPDPAGPTAVCVHSTGSPGPIYNCYGDDVIDKIVRKQSQQYLEREAAKLAPGVINNAPKRQPDA